MELAKYLENEGIINKSNELINDIVAKELNEIDFKEFLRLKNNIYYIEDRDNKSSIINFYDFVYEHNLNKIIESRLYNRTMEVTPIINDKLANYKNILDLGTNCGFKIVYHAINNSTINFTGIDISKKTLNKAKQNAAKYNCKNITFEKASIEDINLEKKFDCVISSYSMHETNIISYNLDNGERGLDPNYLEKLFNIYNILDKGRLILVFEPFYVDIFKERFPEFLEAINFRLDEIIKVNYIKSVDIETSLIFIAEKN